jgi:diguanylate cyclase
MSMTMDRSRIGFDSDRDDRGVDDPGFSGADQDALAFLEDHCLARTPDSYALALQAVLHPYGPLGQEVARRTDGGVRLTSNDVGQLMPLVREQQAVAADRRPGAAQAQLERDLGDHAEQLEALTTDAREITNAFTSDVAALSLAHHQQQGGSAESGAITQLLQELIARIARTESALEALSGNIATLRTRIEQTPQDGDIDRLTGLMTRTGAQPLIEQMADEAHGYIIAACGLDDLDDIQERYGRTVAGTVLRAFATTLRQMCEGAEIVRWQDDVFAVILRGGPMSAITRMMEDARSAMQGRTLRLRGSGEPIGLVTMSGGIATGIGPAVDDAFARADALREMASRGVGNRILSRA